MILATKWEREAAENAAAQSASTGKLKDKKPDDYSETISAQKLLNQIPPIKTVGTRWHAYGAGVWKETSIHSFRPQALAILEECHRSNKHALDILHHIEGLSQVPESELGSFYKFDREDVFLNVGNGVLKVGKGYQINLLPHSPDFQFTLQIAAPYEPEATCLLFEKTLEETLPDPRDRVMFQAFCGSLLLPSCKFESALVCYGPGGTGKSTPGRPDCKRSWRGVG